MPRKRVSVVKESSSGRNLKFKINRSNKTITRAVFVKKIESGLSGYHVRTINGVKTPVSNPDGKSGNNLG